MINSFVVKCQNIFGTVLIFLVMACTNDDLIQDKHNEFMLEDLRIHSIYNNDQYGCFDTIHLSYDKLDRIHTISKYNNGNVNKRYYFQYSSEKDTNCSIIKGAAYKGMLHGKSKIYGKRDIFRNAEVFKNDTFYYGKYYARDTAKDQPVYYIESPRGCQIGHYYIDNNRKPIFSKDDNFYIIQGKDTTFKNWKNKIDIILSHFEELKFAYLAMDKDTFYFNDKKLELEFDTEELGVSRHFGEIEVTIDTVINGDSLTASANYPFYYEFQVIDLYDYLLPFYEERNNFLYAIDTMPEVQRILNLKEY
jgi:hypothetical protein